MIFQNTVPGYLGNHLAKENYLGPLTHTIHKINSRWIADLNVKGKTVTLLGKSNSREHLHDLGGGKFFFFFFLTRIQKVLALKGKKNKTKHGTFIKIKNFLKRDHKNDEKAANKMGGNSLSLPLSLCVHPTK